MAANRQPLPARLMRTLEDATALDRGVDFLEPAAEGLTADQNVKDALRGEKYLGSPLHPALVHFPIGFAYAAAVVDLLGRFSRPGATVLTAATVACTPISVRLKPSL